MPWRVRGRIFDPAEHDWAGSHAQVPTALVLQDRVRVYYADRFDDGRSYTTWLDLDRGDLSRVLHHNKEPILPFGAPGAFDDDGMMPSFALKHDGRTLLYYSGWNRGVTVPYRNSVGLAVSEDEGLSFRRLYEGPVLERCATEPYIAVTPTILIEDGFWRMWYISGLRWTEVEGRFEPVYVIKYATSTDGVSWARPNHQCLPQSHPDEAFSHPTVIRDERGYHMWFCARGSVDYRDGAGAYRIGYARSPDGLAWERDDAAEGLDVFDGEGATGAGWASTMTCYPFVFQLESRTLMLFNGNGFGRTGFGWAEWEPAP